MTQERKAFPEQLDDFLLAHLDHIALVPLALYLATPLVDLAVVVANGYVSFTSRQVYHTVVETLAYPMGAYFAALLGLAVAWLAARGLLRTSRERLAVLAPLGALLALAVVSTLANPEDPYRISGIGPSYVGIGSYLLFVCAYLWPASVVREGRLRRAACMALCAESVPVGVHALWLAATYGGLPGTGASARPEGVFYNSNHYGYFLAMVVALYAALWALGEGRRLRLLALATLSFNAFVLMRNDTLGAWVACVSALVALCAFCLAARRGCLRRALAAAALFVLVTVAVGAWDGSMVRSVAGLPADVSAVATGSQTAPRAGSGRWRLWVATAKLIAQRPWLGWGAEGICDALYATCGLERAHCEPLMYAAYFGVPALCCYLAGCAAAFACAWRRRRALGATEVACLVAALAYLVSSCFGNMYFYTTPFFFMLLGLGLRPPEVGARA